MKYEEFRASFFKAVPLSEVQQAQMDQGVAAILGAIRREFDQDQVEIELVTPRHPDGQFWSIGTPRIRIPLLFASVLDAGDDPDYAEKIAGQVVSVLKLRYGGTQ